MLFQSACPRPFVSKQRRQRQVISAAIFLKTRTTSGSAYLCLVLVIGQRPGRSLSKPWSQGQVHLWRLQPGIAGVQPRWLYLFRPYAGGTGGFGGSWGE